eukprot:13231455-Ditylum_brightwellii.AAC.1
MAITAKTVTASFLHPVSPRLPGDPTYERIYKVNKILNKNTGSVQCILGSGRHSLLGLTIRSADYTLETGHAFIPSLNTPLNPVSPG